MQQHRRKMDAQLHGRDGLRNHQAGATQRGWRQLGQGKCMHTCPQSSAAIHSNLSPSRQSIVYRPTVQTANNDADSAG